MKALFLISVFLFFFSDLLAQGGTVLLKTADGTIVGTYSSLGTAYAAIPSPATTGYIIEFLSGYNASSEIFPITLKAKSGLDDSKRVIIRPAVGATNILISANLNNPVITLDSADYITFDGRPGGVGNDIHLKIENLNSTGSSAHTIRLINGATNNQFLYLHLYGAPVGTAGPRNIDFTTSANDPAGNSFNLIQYCKLEGSRTGVGFAGTAANPNSDNVIKNCKIYNFGYAGIWLSSQVRGITIEENEIYHTSPLSNSTIVSGIISSTSTFGNIFIKKNKFYDLQSGATTATSIRGIYFTPAPASVINIENNFVSMTKDNINISAYYGIHIIGTNQHTSNVFYNSILIGGNHSTGGTSGTVVTAGILYANSNTASIINSKNNISVNVRTGGGGILHLAHHVSNLNPILDINYNTYYVPSQPNSFHAGWGTSYFNSITDYRTAAAPNESYANFKQVFFVSSTDLHLSGTSIGDTDLIGIPITGITTDIDGDLRHPSNPYRGADEPFVEYAIGWCNLNNPPTAVITQGDSVAIFAQIFISSVTPLPGPGHGINAWIGVSTTNTDPSTWTMWIPATFYGDAGLNDEFIAYIGKNLSFGTYYYASKFQYGTETRYGGYSSTGGGFWDGVNNVSGVLTVNPLISQVSFTTDSLWNIVSVPGIPILSHKDSLFVGSVSNAFWFNGTNYVIQNELERGKGYWLRFDQSRNQSLNVILENTLSVQISPGWNLIGNLHINVPVTNVTTTPPNIIVSNFFGYARRGYFIATDLRVGKGYWVKANSTGILQISTTAKSTTTNYIESIDEKWLKIIFTDNSGESRELYLANNFDKNKYDLPPLPPAGSFDVRFSSDKYVEVRNEKHFIKLMADNFPIRMTVINGSILVSDYQNGDITNYILHEKEEIILKNPETKLLIIEPFIQAERFELLQNSPNPFNSITRITFSIPKDEFVELKIFDVLGREVKCVINEFRNRGYHTIELNADDLSSGVYIYSLKAGSNFASRRFVLIK